MPSDYKAMKPLACLTLFLRTGKKFKLESGETFDNLRVDKNETCQGITKSCGQSKHPSNEMGAVQIGITSVTK